MKTIVRLPKEPQILSLIRKWVASLGPVITLVIERDSWKFYITALCALYCIITSMPNYLNFSEEALKRSPYHELLLENYQALDQQSKVPFQPQHVETSSHSSKLAFRFIPALLLHYVPVTDLLPKMLSLYLINNLFGLLFFISLLSLVFKFSNDKLFATLVACNFSILYTGKSFFHDTYLWNDGIAFTFILFSLLSRNAMVVLVCLLAAYFTDERALFSGLLAFAFHKIVTTDSKKPDTLLTTSDLPFILSFIVYFTIRFLLGHFLGLKTPSGNHSGVLPFLRLMDDRFIWTNVLGFLLAYKLGWFFILAPIWWLRNNRLFLAIYCSGIVGIIAASFSVGDLSRSLAYGFVALLIGVYLLYKKSTDKPHWQRNPTLFMLFMLNFLVPTISVVGTTIKFLPPVNKLFAIVVEKGGFIATF
ncbi:hypothetical protein ACFPMF_18155 [Larkinella bovis]|uniref:Glycosyltransferase RgtA/B/C/D-like domain-containing protein n=1 Tax=Larkinella bovis TaxID=683041 RepID=A0ABW0ICM7_9BACT